MSAPFIHTLKPGRETATSYRLTLYTSKLISREPNVLHSYGASLSPEKPFIFLLFLVFLWLDFWSGLEYSMADSRSDGPLVSQIKLAQYSPAVTVDFSFLIETWWVQIILLETLLTRSPASSLQTLLLLILSHTFSTRHTKFLPPATTLHTLTVSEYRPRSPTSLQSKIHQSHKLRIRTMSKQQTQSTDLHLPGCHAPNSGTSGGFQCHCFEGEEERRVCGE